MNRRAPRLLRSVLGGPLVFVLVFVLVGAACTGAAVDARRDPLESSGPLPDEAVVLYTEAIEGLRPVEEGGPPPVFGLALTPTCVIAGIDGASTCMGTEPGSGGAVYDGGIHGDASVAWAVSGDEQVVWARFWMLDGTTFEQQALLADDRSDPPIVFGHAVAAINEIVGIELLDAEGHVVMALSVDPVA